MRPVIPHLWVALHSSRSSLSVRHCTRLLGCRGLPAPAAWPQYQSRGAKSKATVKIQDLPQGMLDGGLPVKESSDGPVYPTVIQQAKMNMRKFENCVVLTRMGGFYEVRWL